MDEQLSLPDAKDPRIQAALRSYIEKVDSGQVPELEAFVEQYPDLADELRSFIETELQLRRMAAPQPAQRATADSAQPFALHGQETIAPKGKGLQSPTGAGPALSGQFGRYRIVSALGQGAMGSVYLAEDTQLLRHVALKTPHFGQEPTSELLQRFYREAQAAATLRHPNICPVYDVGQIEGTHYISMAYIEGHPLSAFIRSNKPQPERQVLMVVRKLALALQEAHDHGIVHRDLKPANIMIDKRNEPIIMDFGLAQQVRPDKDIRITQAGTMIGTPAYMSPEQVDGDLEKIGPATDQYSLGVMLYELLTTQLPFRGSFASVMGQILAKVPTPPSQLRTGLDPRIEAVCLKMMDKSPADRFPSLAAAAEELATILRKPSENMGSSATRQSGAMRPAAGAPGPQAPSSTFRQSSAPTLLAAKDLASLEELARKCLARHDYEQVIQIVERIPENQRNSSLTTLLEKSRAKTDEIAFLLCDIDEAVRLDDQSAALRNAAELLAIKPGHYRALEVQQRFAGYGEGGAARIGSPWQLTQRWKEGGWIPWSVLGFGILVFATMTAVMAIYLNRSAVVVDVKNPGIEVAVKGSPVALVTGPIEKKVIVEPGEQEVTIKYPGLGTVIKKFTLKKGEQRKVTVSIADQQLVAELEGETAPSEGSTGKKQERTNKQERATVAQPPQPTASAPEVFVPLFNGKDLSGWIAHPSEAGGWRVERGILVGSGGPSSASTLYTKRGDYKDFHLRAEVRLTGNEFGGLWLRTKMLPSDSSSSPHIGYRVDLRQHEPSGADRRTGGSLWAVHPGTPKDSNWGIPNPNPLVKRGEWFTVDVIARGNHMVVKLNGRIIADAHWTNQGDNRDYRSGHIAVNRMFEEPAIGARTLELRKIEIAEFATSAPSGVQSPPEQFARQTPGGAENKKSAAPAPVQTPTAANPVAAPEVFVPLFNGKDLTGWIAHPSRSGGWRVDHGILVGRGGRTSASALYTRRGDYKDFHLRAEVRVTSNEFAGLWFRTQIPSDASLSAHEGYRVDLREQMKPEAPTDARAGSLWAVHPMPGHDSYWGHNNPQSLVKRGEWFTVDVIAEGNHTVVMVNGRTTSDGRWNNDGHNRDYRSGHIAVNRMFEEPAIGVRRIEFRKIEIAELGVPGRPENKKLAAAVSSPAHDAGPADATPEVLVPLFNGKDLTGWIAHPSHPGSWGVEHGILVGHGGRSLASTLYTKRGDYQDFHLRAEVRITSNEWAGLWFRTQIPSDPSPSAHEGYRVDLREQPSSSKYWRTGSTWAVRPTPEKDTWWGSRNTESLVKRGEWFTVDVIAKANHITVTVNGHTTSDGRWSNTGEARDYRSGHIAVNRVFEEPAIGVRKLEFRKIEVAELGAPAPGTKK